MKKELGLMAAGVILAGAALMGRPDKFIMSSEDYLERERIFIQYNFTADAIDALKNVPFFIRHTTTNGGGHYRSPFPFFEYAEVYSIQDEAIIHELSHAYYDKKTEEDQTFGDSFMKSVVLAATQDEPYGYYRTLMFGKPGQTFGGIPLNNYTEYFAAIASATMGDVSAMPPPLQEFYSEEFQWNQTPDQNYQP